MHRYQLREQPNLDDKENNGKASERQSEPNQNIKSSYQRYEMRLSWR